MDKVTLTEIHDSVKNALLIDSVHLGGHDGAGRGGYQAYGCCRRRSGFPLWRE